MKHAHLGGHGTIQRRRAHFRGKQDNLLQHHHELSRKRVASNRGAPDLCFLTPERVEDVLERLREEGSRSCREEGWWIGRGREEG